MNKRNIIIAVVALIAAYGFGRWSAPTKVKIETKVVEIEKKTKDTDSEAARDRHKETTTTETTKPDGTKEVTTKIIEDTTTTKKTSIKETEALARMTEETKETTWASSKVTASFMYGIDFSRGGTPVYGGSLTKPILGPLTVGVWGTTPGIGGVSVGLTF